MTRVPFVSLRALFALGLATACTSPTMAQDVRLDVPYVPTAQSTVDEMLKIANVNENDFLIDLGSGDGRIVVSAAKNHGARAMGVDLNPQRIKEANANAQAAGVTDRVKFYQQNLFDTKISDATVLTMYLLPSVNLQLRPRILSELKPGTRVVSHDFDMGDWKPDDQRDLGSDQVYFWIVPAQVNGTWNAKIGDESYKIDLKQHFQEATGTATGNGKTLKVENVRLNGPEIKLDLVDGSNRRTLTGKVEGGTVIGNGWTAKKV